MLAATMRSPFNLNAWIKRTSPNLWEGSVTKMCSKKIQT